MTVSRPVLLVLALIALLLAYPAFADEESGQMTSEQILAHPEVKGALAAIDAFIEGVQIYDKIPGISAGIVSDQDLIWSKGYGYANPGPLNWTTMAKPPASSVTAYT
jgi:CubicO group peptidase (beta-lactamase class C family)